MTSRIEEWARTSIRGNRDNITLRLMARAAERYLNAWYNTGNFDFHSNGEAFLLKQFAFHHPDEAVELWDVGAHMGEFAECAHQQLPSAKITSFEIVPEVAARLRAKNFDPAWFTLRTEGLSDKEGTVSVTCNPRAGTTSAIHPRMGDGWFDEKAHRTVECKVTTIDALVEGGAAPPKFLKIDVEGHEAAVLQGAEGLLTSASAPLAIQFEYGDTWIPASRTLHEVQRRLESFGYRVGRMYKDHVDFKSYAFADERFRMGNMCAVRDVKLIERLSKSNRAARSAIMPSA